jgi:hypothetical protein
LSGGGGFGAQAVRPVTRSVTTKKNEAKRRAAELNPAVG